MNHKEFWNSYAQGVYDKYIANSPLQEKMYSQIIESSMPYMGIGKKIIEIGCATGRFLQALYKINFNQKLFGLDRSEVMLEKFVENNRKKNTTVQIIRGDFTKDDLQKIGIFDICFFVNSFYALFPKKDYQERNIIEIIEKIKRITNPGSIVIIADPDVDWGGHFAYVLYFFEYMYYYSKKRGKQVFDLLYKIFFKEKYILQEIVKSNKEINNKFVFFKAEYLIAIFKKEGFKLLLKRKIKTNNNLYIFEKE